jgi:hypothetical protein
MVENRLFVELKLYDQLKSELENSLAVSPLFFRLERFTRAVIYQDCRHEGNVQFSHCLGRYAQETVLEVSNGSRTLCEFVKETKGDKKMETRGIEPRTFSMRMRCYTPKPNPR